MRDEERRLHLFSLGRPGGLCGRRRAAGLRTAGGPGRLGVRLLAAEETAAEGAAIGRSVEAEEEDEERRQHEHAEHRGHATRALPDLRARDPLLVARRKLLVGLKIGR